MPTGQSERVTMDHRELHLELCKMERYLDHVIDEGNFFDAYETEPHRAHRNGKLEERMKVTRAAVANARILLEVTFHVEPVENAS